MAFRQKKDPLNMEESRGEALSNAIVDSLLFILRMNSSPEFSSSIAVYPLPTRRFPLHDTIVLAEPF